MLIKILYLLFITFSSFSAFMILTSLNQITRLGFIIKVFIFNALIFILLDQYFLGLTYIIVYVGAIAVLFLFVIMMISQDFTPVNNKTNTSFFEDKALYFIFFIIFLFLSIFLSSDNTIDFSNIYNYFYINYFSEFISFTDVQSLAYFLFLAYPCVIILIGIILWIILIGILKISFAN
jgi:NADH:ubiquinone oxidoreductase subunit 6 (subunit J)